MLKKLAKQSLIYVTSDFIIKSTNLILTPYYIYKLSASEFGQFGIIVSVLALGQVFFNLGFQSAIVRFFYLKEEERPVIITSIFSFLTVLSLLTIPIISFALYKLKFFDSNAVSGIDILILVSASAIYGVFIENGIALLKVQEKPVATGILGFASSLTSLLFIILFVELRLFNPLRSIIRGQFIGISIGMLITLIFSSKYFIKKASFKKFRDILSYSSPLVLHNAFQWSLNNADRFIIIKILGADVLGGYFFAYQFATAAKMLFRSVTSSLLASYSQYSIGKIKSSAIKRINHAYLWLVIIVGVILCGVAPIVLKIFHLTKYESSLPLIPLLVAGACFYGLYYIPMNILSITLGKTKILYLVSLAASIFSVIGNLLFVHLGAQLAAIVNFISYLILLVGFILLADRNGKFKDSVNKRKMYLGIILISLISIILALNFSRAISQ